MIQIRGKIEENSPSNKIIFEPRHGFSRGKGRTKTLEYPLIYGHKCPFCNNVMQALFKAPQTFNLWPYEETILLSQGEKNSGEIRKTYPDEKTTYGKSCYRMDYSPAEGGSVKLTLKNHIIGPQVLQTRQYTGEGVWEVGEKPCTKAGIFSLRGDLLAKDFMLFSRIQDSEVDKYKIPDIRELNIESNVVYKVVKAIGKVPPVVLTDRTSYIFGWTQHSRSILLQCKNLKSI